jgi:hypothetical protein
MPVNRWWSMFFSIKDLSLLVGGVLAFVGQPNSPGPVWFQAIFSTPRSSQIPWTKSEARNVNLRKTGATKKIRAFPLVPREGHLSVTSSVSKSPLDVLRRINAAAARDASKRELQLPQGFSCCEWLDIDRASLNSASTAEVHTARVPGPVSGETVLPDQRS